MPLTILQPDLFGGDTQVVQPAHSPYQRFKTESMYRDAESDWKNCRTCSFSFMAEGRTKNYRKCSFMGFSRSAASDVSSRMVCNRWE